MLGQSSSQVLVISECLACHGLLPHGLMHALNAVFTGWGVLDEPYRDPERYQIAMEESGKGRRAGIVIEHAIVIQAEALGQAVQKKGTPQDQLIISGVWMGGVQTRKILHLESAAHVHNVDNGNLTDVRYRQHSLRIHCPFLMHLFDLPFLRLRQFAVPLIGPGVALLFQEHGDVRPARPWHFLTGRGAAPLRVERVRTPTKIFLPNRSGEMAQCAGRWPTHGRGQSRATFSLIATSPLTHVPDRVTQRFSNFSVGLPCCPALTYTDPFFQGRGSSFLFHCCLPRPKDHP